MKTTEELLDSLRDEAGRLWTIAKVNPELLVGESVAIDNLCSDFLRLDMLLTEGDSLPGAWGKSKLSKSQQQ